MSDEHLLSELEREIARAEKGLPSQNQPGFKQKKPRRFSRKDYSLPGEYPGFLVALCGVIAKPFGMLVLLYGIVGAIVQFFIFRKAIAASGFAAFLDMRSVYLLLFLVSFVLLYKLGVLLAKIANS